MSKDMKIRRDNLIHNPTPRVPVCFVLDRSPSMSGDPSLGSSTEQLHPRPIDELNKGVLHFFNALKEDEIAKYSAEVSIVAFSGSAEKILDFDTIINVRPPTIDLELEYGGTSIGSAVDLGMRLLDDRKNEYKDAGVDYYQPWLVIMTDGDPTDDTHEDASEKVRKLVKEKKLSVFPIGIGDGANMEVLKMFSPLRDPLKLKGLKFKEFFEWLSYSVSKVSSSIPGEAVPLDQEGIKGWADI